MTELRERALPREFYRRTAVALAPALLGCILVSDDGSDRTAGRISELIAFLQAICKEQRHYAVNVFLTAATTRP